MLQPDGGRPVHSFMHPGRAARLVLIVTAVWLMLGVFMGLQFYFNGTAAGVSVELWPAIRTSIQNCLILALLTFPVLWLCRRHPPTRKRWLAALSAHTAGFVLFVILFGAIRMISGTAVSRVTLEQLPVSLETWTSLVRSSLFEMFTRYASIAIAALALQYARQCRQREVLEAELKQQMAEYELQALKLQLQPHFLFNAMNGISTLMTRDVRTARQMLVRLSELLRMALSQSMANEVSLRDEIEFVKAYLEIESMRFGQRLRVDIQVDQASLDALVPNMIIQPLVENGIRYGIARHRGGGTLALSTSCDRGRLHIRIANDGPPAEAARHHVNGSGVGLGNARARLRQLYGEDYQFRLMQRPHGGAELHLDIPFRGAGRPLEGYS
ncbi:MAG: sensor histidine kinase [Candidatus Polarisedimenticolia bacterium]